MSVKSIFKNVEWYKSEFEKFESNLDGQSKSVIHKLRREAINQLSTNGFPSTRNEEWKYTNVQPILETAYQPIHEYKEGILSKSDVSNLSYSGMDCYKVVFLNGHFAKDLSDVNELSEKIFISDLRDAINSNNDHVNQFLSRYAGFEDSFTALSTAFIQDGILLHVPKNLVLEKPIHLMFINAGDEDNILSHPRNLIIADSNSKATIIESHMYKEDLNYFANIVSEIILNANALVKHIKIQNESTKAFHISSLHTHQEKDSNFQSFVVNLGGKLVRNNIRTILNGSGAECTLNGVYLGHQDQLIDNRTIIEHAKPNCFSTQLYKGIMNDNARGVFNGKIHVYQAAQKTNAIQSNKGLLLSENASFDTKPQLEIYADDVRCTHGATIGQLEKDALFYLQSRGIGLERAKNLLINAFASEVLDQIKIESIKSDVENRINDKLHLNSV